MSNINDTIKETLISYSGRINRYKTNAPKQYADRQHQYYADETRLFAEQYDRFSSDYVEALVQGLQEGDPYGYTKVHIRLANMITGASALVTVYDNYKTIEIAERQYTYIRRGAKIKTMGNTWLAINPNNMSGVQGHAVIERCDQTWNHLDYYGNVLSEPVCVDRLDMRGVDPDAQRATMINTGYYAIKLQYNDQTTQLGNNSRLILGDSAYLIAGYAEISREFTEEQDTVNMMIFRAMAEEPNFVIDDMENRVAGGKTFSWDISVSGEPMVMVGESIKLSATSIRTAEERTLTVESTEEHPISYIWTSSDDEIVSVTSAGVVTGLSEGSATITCALEQNPSKRTEFSIEVQGDMTAPHLAFTTTIPESLKAYHTAYISAEYYENGEAVSDAELEWNCTGADHDSYEALRVDNNTIMVKCWSGSVNPLEISVTYAGKAINGTIQLEGI